MHLIALCHSQQIVFLKQKCLVYKNIPDINLLCNSQVFIYTILKILLRSLKTVTPPIKANNAKTE